MFLSLHIPKTAGTSFGLYLEENLGPKLAFSYRQDAGSHPALKSLDLKDLQNARAALAQTPIELIHGHYMWAFTDIYPQAPVLVCLRAPLARAVSNYRHMQRSVDAVPALSEPEKTGAVSLEEYLSRARVDYAKVLERLHRSGRPVAVLLHDRIDAGITVMNETLGWRGRLPVANTSPGATHKTAGEDYAALPAEIRDAYAQDISVYDDHVAQWDNGSGKDAFAQALKGGPRRYQGLTRARLRNHLKRLLGRNR